MVTSLTTLFALYYFFFAKKMYSNQKELRLIKTNLQTITKQANDIILVIDLVYGNIYSANDKASELLSYSNEELLNKTIHDLHPKELLNLSSQTIAKVWDEKGLVYQNLPFVDANGEKIEVECSAKILVYNDEPAILIYARDITERLILEREILQKNELIIAKNESITDSINYASRIQKVILGETDDFKQIFNDAFIFYKPHSIVSGDFYWYAKIENKIIVIAADCTGHGVPGAFLTILGHNFLEDIVRKENTFMPNEILSKLNHKMLDRLGNKETDTGVKDGIDVSILSFDLDSQKVYFSGAKNPLLLIKGGMPTRIKGSSFSIGGSVKDKSYDLNELELEKGTTYYLYSDGFQDQFGGENNKKYMAKKFREYLASIHKEEMDKQLINLEKEFNSWKGNYSQTDDILVIGIKV